MAFSKPASDITDRLVIQIINNLATDPLSGSSYQAILGDDETPEDHLAKAGIKYVKLSLYALNTLVKYTKLPVDMPKRTGRVIAGLISIFPTLRPNAIFVVVHTSTTVRAVGTKKVVGKPSGGDTQVRKPVVKSKPAVSFFDAIDETSDDDGDEAVGSAAAAAAPAPVPKKKKAPVKRKAVKMATAEDEGSADEYEVDAGAATAAAAPEPKKKLSLKRKATKQAVPPAVKRQAVADDDDDDDDDDDTELKESVFGLDSESADSSDDDNEAEEV